MARPSKLERTWSDAQLTDAVAGSTNWRNVMRKLGLNAGSAGAIRIVRRDVERLGLDTSHSGAGASGPMRGLGVRSWIRIPGMSCLTRWVWRQVAGIPEPDYRGPGRHSVAYLHQVHRGQCGRAHGAGRRLNGLRRAGERRPGMWCGGRLV